LLAVQRVQTTKNMRWKMLVQKQILKKEKKEKLKLMIPKGKQTAKKVMKKVKKVQKKDQLKLLVLNNNHQ